MMRKNTKTKNTAIKLKPKGGIKAPRKAKSTLLWESEFLPILKSLHGNHAQRIFHRVMKKSSTLRSTLKRRSKEYEVVFKISLPEIRRLLLRAYGSKCKYCRNILDVRNMVCDHMVPLSCGGPSTLPNVEMICRRCNTRKGPLTSEQYHEIVNWLNLQPEQVSSYILRKLSGKDVF